MDRRHFLRTTASVGIDRRGRRHRRCVRERRPERGPARECDHTTEDRPLDHDRATSDHRRYAAVGRHDLRGHHHDRPASGDDSLRPAGHQSGRERPAPAGRVHLRTPGRGWTTRRRDGPPLAPVPRRRRLLPRRRRWVGLREQQRVPSRRWRRRRSAPLRRRGHGRRCLHDPGGHHLELRRWRDAVGHLAVLRGDPGRSGLGV